MLRVQKSLFGISLKTTNNNSNYFKWNQCIFVEHQKNSRSSLFNNENKLNKSNEKMVIIDSIDQCKRFSTLKNDFKQDFNAIKTSFRLFSVYNQITNFSSLNHCFSTIVGEHKTEQSVDMKHLSDSGLVLNNVESLQQTSSKAENVLEDNGQSQNDDSQEFQDENKENNDVTDKKLRKKKLKKLSRQEKMELKAKLNEEDSSLFKRPPPEEYQISHLYGVGNFEAVVKLFDTLSDPTPFGINLASSAFKKLVRNNEVVKEFDYKLQTNKTKQNKTNKQTK
jgi:hypothetical protein